MTGPRNRWPAGLRAAIAACGLLAVGATAIAVASGVVARSYLMGQADRELRAEARQLAAGPLAITPTGAGRYLIIPPGARPHQTGQGLPTHIASGPAGPAPGPGTAGLGAARAATAGSPLAVFSAAGAGLDRGFLAEVTSPAGRLVLRAGPGTPPGPAAARLPHTPGRPAAVPASRGSGSWLVISTPVHYQALRIAYTYGSGGFALLVNGPAQRGQPGRLVTALNLAPGEAAVSHIIRASAAAGVVAVLALAALTLGLARSAAGRARQASAGREAAARRSAQELAGQLGSICQALQPPLRVISGFAASHRDRGPGRAVAADRVLRRIGEEVARLEDIMAGLPTSPPGDRPAARNTRGPAR